MPGYLTELKDQLAHSLEEQKELLICEYTVLKKYIIKAYIKGLKR